MTISPAAAETILTHFEDTGHAPDYYDLIITGDLGTHGSDLLKELCKRNDVDISKVHEDCGAKIFMGQKGINCGGSGCGCSALALCGYYFNRLKAGSLSRILFVATGALLSPTSSMQKESIPSIAHGVVIERRA